MGSSVGVKSPSPSVSLVLQGIENSFDETKLRSAPEKFDSDFGSIKHIKITNSRSRVRSTLILAPLKAGLRLIRARKFTINCAVC